MMAENIKPSEMSVHQSDVKMDTGCSSNPSVSPKYGDPPILKFPRGFLDPTPGGSVYNSPPSRMDQPKDQVTNNGQETDLPQKVLFPPEPLQLAWTRVYSVGASLKNMGNTCFLNSVLQCLTYTPPLANYLLSREHSRTCHNKGFCMMCIMESHIVQVFDKPGEVICPHQIIKELHNFAEHFIHGNKEDAHEFLKLLLYAMQQSSQPASPCHSKTETTSVIDQIFGGCLRSRVKCFNCHSVSDTYETFLDLSLEIQSVSSVQEALEMFMKPEQLGGDNAYKCSKCKNLAVASKAYTVHNMPNMLIASLKRFDYSGRKISKKVTCSEYLDLQEFMSKPEEQPVMYQLYAVLVHSGYNSHAGHYFSYVKASDDHWWKINDDVVSLSNIETVVKEKAYLLFYKKLNQGSKAMSEPLPLLTPLSASTSLSPHMSPNCFGPDESASDFTDDPLPDQNPNTSGQHSPFFPTLSESSSSSSSTPSTYCVTDESASDFADDPLPDQNPNTSGQHSPFFPTLSESSSSSSSTPSTYCVTDESASDFADDPLPDQNPNTSGQHSPFFPTLSESSSSSSSTPSTYCVTDESASDFTDDPLPDRNLPPPQHKKRSRQDSRDLQATKKQRTNRKRHSCSKQRSSSDPAPEEPISPVRIRISIRYSVIKSDKKSVAKSPDVSPTRIRIDPTYSIIKEDQSKKRKAEHMTETDETHRSKQKKRKNMSTDEETDETRSEHKKKKDEKHRDGDSDQDSPDEARRWKRLLSDVEDCQDDKTSPAKRCCTDRSRNCLSPQNF